MKTKGGLDIPRDLALAVEADATVLLTWHRLRPSCQHKYVASVLDAKRPDTRERRVAAVVKATLEWGHRHPPNARSLGDNRAPALLA